MMPSEWICLASTRRMLHVEKTYGSGNISSAV